MIDGAIIADDRTPESAQERAGEPGHDRDMTET